MNHRILGAFLCLAGTLGACSSNSTNETVDMAAAVDQSTATPDSATGADLATGTSLSFFITSRKGSGDLGGIAGADAICQQLATAVGAGGKKWAAYLSLAAINGMQAVNARDRIGSGPWYNAKQVKIANDVADLHQQTMGISATTGVDETGATVPVANPNEHDILTGSTAQGMVNGTATCNNWTSANTTDIATVGHYNRAGGGAAPTSWNSAHNTPGCSAAQLNSVGGAGRFYCFATN